MQAAHQQFLMPHWILIISEKTMNVIQFADSDEIIKFKCPFMNPC